ncbi:MAG: TetR family transcriptional regulator, partial [Nonomuraea sp.]|nr:TetR family transcriptional regulator [Nonomuraea sp.]
LTPDATMDALVGPIVYRVLTGSPVPADLVDTLLDDLLKPRSGSHAG